MYSVFSGSSPQQQESLWTRGTRSPDSGLSPVTPSTPSEYRWSDVIPPKTALKFAVIWDDSEDYVAFSGGELLDDSRTEDIFLSTPISPSDACSQVLSLGPTSTIPLSDQASTMMYFREDMGSMLDPSSPGSIPTSRNRKVLGQKTRTSSTLDGLDVYLRGSLLRQGHRNVRYYSCLENLDGEFDFDPQTSFAKEYCMRQRTGGKGEDVVGADDAVTDEGFYEVLIAPRQRDHSNLNGPSQKRGPYTKPKNVYAYSSVTETSSVTDTQNLGFISIEADDASSIWSTVEAPKLPGYTGFMQCMNQRSPSTRRQRLRKPRPPNVPAPPSEVLRREVFSHQVRLPLENPNPNPKRSGKVEDSRSTSSQLEQQHRKSSLVRLVRQISKKNSNVNSKSASVLGGDNQWICVEVSHEVRQRQRCM